MPSTGDEESAPTSVIYDIADDEERVPYNSYDYVPNELDEGICPDDDGYMAPTPTGTMKGGKGQRPAIKPKLKEVNRAKSNPERRRLLPSEGHPLDLQPSEHKQTDNSQPLNSNTVSNYNLVPSPSNAISTNQPTPRQNTTMTFGSEDHLKMPHKKKTPFYKKRCIIHLLTGFSVGLVLATVIILLLLIFGVTPIFDECTILNGGCNQTCNNLLFSHECLCNSGFTLNPDGMGCDDLDECALSMDGCKNQTCINLVGSFQCICTDNHYNLSSDGKACVDLCPPPFEKHSTGCYLFVNETVDWMVANQTCGAFDKDVHLATPDSKEKLDEMRGIMVTNSVSSSWIYAGKNVNDTVFQFYQTGQKIPDNLWATGAGQFEQCVSL